MKRLRLALALAGLFVMTTTLRAQFADAVISYNPGTGFASGFTNAASALGAPGAGAGVTPFAPPFSSSQIVSIGAGGEITLQFNTPILNNPADPFGVNLIIFANEFFVSSGGNVSGLFYHPASILVQVSADDSTWYTLNPALAPQAGQLYPTDGSGNPLSPVNPALTLSNFTGLNLAGIRGLYAGSAGGTGYDLAWAQDTNGNSVNLNSANFIRVEVQGGVLDMDAISVVPEPAAGATLLAGAGLFGFARQRKSPGRRSVGRAPLPFLAVLMLAVTTGHATTITENFSTNPLQNGWQVFGDTNLFQWDSTNQDLEVTWDSSQPNSYFHRPLGTILAIDDSFTVEFDLQLTAVQAIGSFELAVGLLHLADATNASFSRPAGDTPNLFEFDYFPDGGYGPSIDATLADMTVSATNQSDFYFAYDDTLSMNTGVNYHIVLTHEAASPTISGEVLTNGQVFTSLPNVFPGPIIDFRLDTLSITSYSAAGDIYGDSILAQGTVDNFVVTLPPPPIQNFSGVLTNAVWQGQFLSRSNWLYTLERTADFQTWTNVSAAVAGNGTNMILLDTSPPLDRAFYRVSAARP